MKRVRCRAWLALMLCLLLPSGALAERVVGALTPLPLVLGEGTDAEIGLDDALEQLRFRRFCDGDTVYLEGELDEDGALCFATLALDTMRLGQAKLAHDFGEETVLKWQAEEGFCSVFTDRAAYRFDTKLALVWRAAWPDVVLARIAAMAEEGYDGDELLWNEFDLNASGTQVCYSINVMQTLGDEDEGEQEGIYACAMTPGAQPRRLLTTGELIPSYGEEVWGYEEPRFIREDRVFVRSFAWNWANGWAVYDLDGALLQREFMYQEEEGDMQPWRHEARNRQGILMHRPYEMRTEDTYYFDHATMAVERLPVLALPPYRGEWVFCALEGKTCTFAVREVGLYGQTKRIQFYRYEIGASEVERLPLTLNGAALLSAALVPDGRILLVYAPDDGSLRIDAYGDATGVSGVQAGMFRGE